jgi:UDP-N-acetylmuramoyl-L-alanyl-D-glutamate--2,6-diaminopimelate ligase
MMKIIRSVWHFAWALFSALYYAFPSWRIKVIGITGTKGKSTTLELLSAMLEAEGFKTALLSSVYVKVGEKRQRNLTGNSMPGRGFAQRFLYEAVSAGCDFALLEVTSEGTLQHRHRFIAFDAGGITNLKPEHIEAHGSFEAYRDAKLAFFRAVVSSCKKEKKLFVRQDDDAVAPFAALKPEITTLFSLEDIVAPPTVWGEINAENIALAAAVACAFGVSQASITKALLEFQGLPGRLEFIQENPFS